jgi:hypothetical protein
MSYTIDDSLARENAYFMAHMNEPNDLGPCGKEGHVPGCPGKAGGDHEWLPDWIDCAYCNDGLDLAGDDVVHSWALDVDVHRDCLIDSGEVA